jgi:hypothetical protein
MESREQETVSLEKAKEQVAKACRRIAMLHIAYARTLVEEFGPEEGKRLAKRAIKAYGKMVGETARERAKNRGLESTPGNYVEDLPEFGLYEELEKIETEEGLIRRLKGCAMGKTWREMGEEELGRIYCYIDPAKSMSYNPDWALVHKTCMPDGDPHCDLCYRRTTEEEKSDFLKDDTDFENLDKP